MRVPEPTIEELDAHPLEGDEEGVVSRVVDTTSTVEPTRSIPPESLRKPFASLTPQQLGSQQSKPGGPPMPPSQLFAETASMRPPQPSIAPGRAQTSERGRTNPTARAADRGRTTSPRPTETKERTSTARHQESAITRRVDSQKAASPKVAKYGTCRTHGTALSREGTCILCARDQAKARSQRTMRWIIALVVLALLGGAAIALDTLR